MSNQDDFNIFPEEPAEPGWSSRPWVWVLLIAAIAIFAFAVGMAVSTFSNRVRNGEANALPTPTLMGTKVTVPTFTNVPTTAITATATANDQPTATNTPTMMTAPTTPAPVATPATPVTTATLAGCQRVVYAPFMAIYDSVRLGCAVNDAGLVWSAWETFERGYMFWRSDNNRAYAFFTDNSWLPVNERWDGQPAPSRGEPPAGLRAPERGFGYAWGVRDDFFRRLGWATDQERGFCAIIQSFERGFILQSSDVEFCQDNLYNHARAPEWQPLLLIVTNDGFWRNFAGGASPGTPPVVGTTPTVATPTVDATATALAIATPLPTATTVVDPGARRPRPSRNGTFIATTQLPATLDGILADWQGNWYPINTVVQGNNNYTGADDIGGDFQAAWSRDGLYLAVRVRDDRYRAGPAGTDMWQGDGLELHLDRFLTLDYDSTIADADDYQLGISFGPDRNELRIYRWLPFEKEGQLNGSGALTPVGEGYDLELFLPWSFFDIGGDEVAPNQHFGFNLSINDNDADAPAQESVLSASPSRTTYNNPTEWGTLVLGN